MFLKEDSYAQQGYIYGIKNSNIAKYYYHMFSNLYILQQFISVMLSWIFSIIQSSVSHDPSEIILICWFAAQVAVIMLKTVVLLNIW